MNDGPPLIFSLLGVAFGVLVAWLITGEGTMALVFLVLGIAAVVGFRWWQGRRR